MRDTIRYGIDADGDLISRLGDGYAVPVQAGGTHRAHLTYRDSGQVGAAYLWGVRWTRKIPTSSKNEHRAFWGLLPLRDVSTNQRKG